MALEKVALGHGMSLPFCCAQEQSWRRTQTEADPGAGRLWDSGRQGDPTGVRGELHEGSRLIHGALLSALGEDTKASVRVKPAGAHTLPWDKHWDSVRLGSRAGPDLPRADPAGGSVQLLFHSFRLCTQPNTAHSAGRECEWGLPLDRKPLRKGRGCFSPFLCPIRCAVKVSAPAHQGWQCH